MVIASIEYWIEAFLVPSIKLPWVTYIGIALVLAGEVLRKVGIITAGHNFTQRVQFEHRPQHVLVTQGIYKYMRHPGYAGWVLWAIGTQLVLCNPICTVLFAYLVSGKNDLMSASMDFVFSKKFNFSIFFADFEVYDTENRCRRPIAA